ncbi:FecCD family ABC transporter permease [Marinicrinis sediminis]|uniref:FecCD family ABC transporter permease n=1 Tax=Marinicrinis sediminis TaxID=1652465 RepID=A0ABW5RFJ1_9BACL
MSKLESQHHSFHSQHSKKRIVLVTISLIVLTLLLSILNLSMGSMSISFWNTIKVLLGMGEPNHELVIIEFRLARMVAALLIGAALAVSGALLQGIIRNPLAAPDLLGVTGGASVFVVAFMTLFTGTYSIHWTPLIAIAGAFFAASLNYMFAWKDGVSPYRLVLIGLGISTALHAITTFLFLSGPAHLASQVLNWMTGSIYGTSWADVNALFPWVAVFIPLAWLFSNQLNVMALGDQTATGLGIRLQLNRMLLLLFSVALAGAAVGFAGTIAFIGLLAPHIARKLVGPTYGILIPVSALTGGMILLAADLAGRMLFEPLDIPAGVFTASIGAPFFLYLLYRR